MNYMCVPQYFLALGRRLSRVLKICSNTNNKQTIRKKTTEKHQLIKTKMSVFMVKGKISYLMEYGKCIFTQQHFLVRSREASRPERIKTSRQKMWLDTSYDCQVN